MKFLCALFLFASVIPAGAQQPYVQGASVKDFPMKRVLNFAVPATSLHKVKKELTVIDFFGTWCVPCIKVLVSIEQEEKLQNFLLKQPNFGLPLVVDEGAIAALFQPPSYPYSIVLDDKGVGLALLSDASGLTDAAIKEWLDENVRASGSSSSNITSQTNAPVTLSSKSTNPLILLSQEFIYAAKTGDELTALQTSLEEISYAALRGTLKSDTEKKAFWINIYNGFANAILKASPEKYKHRGQFFQAKQIPVAGKIFSLDEVEHDILRRSKIKWSLGYFNKIFPSKGSHQLQVDSLDYRIHFGLNCGAKSCPPIAYYTPEGLDAQLEAATRNYLGGEVTFDKDRNIVELPALMSWFRADFGGKKGMIAILKKHGIIPAEAYPKIRFKNYDWNLELNNYKHNSMSNHYYNAEDLAKFGNIGDYQKELGDKFFAYYGEVFKDSALSAREKSLIALAVAHAVQCPYCIDAYSSDAFEKGYSEAQMMEAVHVAGAIKGGAVLVHGVQMMNKVKEIAM